MDNYYEAKVINGLPMFFPGKIVVTTVTKEKTLDSLGKIVGIVETEVTTTYEHISNKETTNS